MSEDDTTVLLVCERGAETESLREAFAAHDWRLKVMHDVDRARRALHSERMHCAIICDDPGRVRIDAFMRQREDHVPTIVAVRRGDVARTVVAMQLGARTVVEMPPGRLLPSPSGLITAIEEFVSGLRTKTSHDPRDVFVRSPDSPINTILDVLPQLARSDAAILITGESGTGKDLLARTIHEMGPRRAHEFVAVNCGAIPNELLESELFGAKRGAYTGATSDRIGRIQSADGGTLFLDEIGEMPPQVQVKLLRVLHDKKVLPVGATTPTEVDFRVICATNREIEAEIQAGRFREDLYYRVSVLPMELPALRDRPQDIPVLAEHFIEEQNAEHGTDIVGLTREVRGLLKRYDWPGNVRELRNLIERICVLKSSGFIERGDLTPHILDAPPSPMIGLDVPSEGIDMTETLETLEDRLLVQALEKTRGNKARAARLLGINRTTLVEKLKRKQISFDE